MWLENSKLVIAGNGSEKGKLISLANNLHGITIEFWNAPLLKVPEIQNKADVLLLSLKKGAAKIALLQSFQLICFQENQLLPM